MARIALFALIVFALVFVVGSYGARRVGGSRRNPAERAPGGSIDSRSMSATPSASGLARWVAAGLLTDTQAKAIIEYEQQSRAPQPAPVVTPIVEAIAYVGGVLLAVGSGMLIARFWESIGTAGHLVGGAIVAIVTGIGHLKSFRQIKIDLNG